MSRISRQQMFMEMARTASKRSTCFRLNVGAVVVVNNRPVSIGYNGTPAGATHCTGNSCPGKGGCKETIHAEVNALDYVPSDLRYTGKDLYVTDSPCLHCASIIKARHVLRVFFEKPYRITDGIDYLLEAGIEVYQVTPSGYVIEWVSKEIVDL